jgi:hypothetical protein
LARHRIPLGSSGPEIEVKPERANAPAFIASKLAVTAVGPTSSGRSSSVISRKVILAITFMYPSST